MISILNYVRIRLCLIKYQKNHLPKKVLEEVASNLKLLKIKPRFLKFKFSRLTILGILPLLLLGFQPTLTFGPVRQTWVRAEEPQKQEIISDTLPSINLPHPGYLSTRFSRWHPGVDIATGLGMPIHPVTEGLVEEVNFGFLGYGNHIIVSHPKGLKSLYGHMGRIFVKKGQTVTSEETLGFVGLSGFTSGPHTHLEITKDGQTIDPLTILPPLRNFPSEEYLKPVGGEGQKLTKSLKPDFN